jgi:hypothetical protein
MPSTKSTDALANRQAEFSGRYIAHWEISHVHVEVGRWFFGLLPKCEQWTPIFPSEFKLPTQELYKRNWLDHPGRLFFIRFIGVPSELGRFGHFGGCQRHVAIRQVIEIEDLGDRGLFSL